MSKPIRVLPRLSMLAALLFSAGTAAAQQTNVPYGSPLNGDQSQQPAAQPQAPPSAYPVPYERVGPTRLEDSSNPTTVDSRDSDSQTNDTTTNRNTTTTNASDRQDRQRTTSTLPPRPAPQNEFERFVEKQLGRPLPRFGADLLVPAQRNYTSPTTTAVPPAYKLSPGDEIFIGLSGSIEGSVSRQIDSSGRIFLPRVGSINLAGVSYGDLKTVIERAVAIKYRGFDVSVAVTRLRGIRVFVTGFANNPGSYTVDSLSTLINAVFAAGGPSSGGSFRSARLIRNGEVVSDLDLYRFLRGGDRSQDAVLQNGDVLYIAPLGAQVALTGSVNQEAIYEARPGETLDDLLRFAGGATALADPDRLILYSLANANTVGAVEVARPAFAAQPVSGGDIVQILSTGTLANPLERQTVVVRIDGEVGKPGNYVVAPNTRLDQVIAQAGGTTPRAFLYGTVFQRLTVRRQQRESFDEAIRQFETTLVGAPLTSDRALTPDQQAAQLAAGRGLLERLRAMQPDGRVVLPIEPNGAGLPVALTLENNDTIYIPPRPTTVGVFGAVYRPASFLLDESRPMRLRDYIDLAGGPLRFADRRNIFVVRANGAVLSRRSGALSARVLPGDVVFVPTKTQNVSLLQKIGAITSILFQTAVGALAVREIAR